jgi:DDE superfamily endonuclease
VDSFETPVPRPSTSEKQTRLYSGKKKDHTLKTQVVTDAQGEILDIDAGHRGPMSDKRLYEQSDVPTQFPNAQKQADKAYVGIEGMQTPQKKPRGAELTHEQKEANRVLSSSRVHVEHGIRRIKAFRIVRDEYRLGTGLFRRVASSVVGLVQLVRLVS